MKEVMEHLTGTALDAIFGTSVLGVFLAILNYVTSY